MCPWKMDSFVRMVPEKKSQFFLGAEKCTPTALLLVHKTRWFLQGCQQIYTDREV